MDITANTILWDLAADLLDAAETTLTDAGLDLPDHRLITWHAPAWDCCNHLVVHISNIQPARAGTAGQVRHQAHFQGNVHDIDFVVTLVGCATFGDPIPADDAIMADSEDMYTRGWVLYQGLVCRYFRPEDDEGLPTDFDGAKYIKVGALSPKPPQGGCQAVSMKFTVQLTG